MVLPEGLGSTGLYQYFIKVVPTVFRDGNKRKLLTNQYTFTERFRPLMLPDPTSGLLTAVRHNSALLALYLIVLNLT
jgi:Endoplasmic reticulum vesicle transporter